MKYIKNVYFKNNIHISIKNFSKDFFTLSFFYVLYYNSILLFLFYYQFYNNIKIL